MRLPACAALVALPALLLAVPTGGAQQDGQGITVAVLDSGVDSRHPEMAGRVERLSFAPLAPLPLPVDVGGLAAEDPDGQGTAVASLVAGATLGLAPSARVLDLQVSPAYPAGQELAPTAEAAAIEALDYLLQDPGRAQVAVLSFAGRGVSPAGAATLASQAERLADAGVLVVVPAAPQLSALHASPAVLTVGAPDCPPSSGTQSGAGQPLKPDLVAQAANLQAAAPGTPLNGAPTRAVSGTPYAAALAAGAGALVRGAQELPVDAAAAILRGSATDAGDPGIDGCNGFGRLNPAAAVAMAEAWEDPLAGRASRGSPAAAWPALAALAAAAAVVAARRRA